MKKSQENYKKYALELVDLLNKWDFLEVTKYEISNEYTDLVGPILSKLYKGTNEEELSDFVWQRIKISYGIKNKPNNIEGFVSEVINWWKS